MKTILKKINTHRQIINATISFPSIHSKSTSAKDRQKSSNDQLASIKLSLNT